MYAYVMRYVLTSCYLFLRHVRIILQVTALRAGFLKVMSAEMLKAWAVTPGDLQEMVCGANETNQVRNLIGPS
eukprot:5585862-Pyramimonas_sp.AAC.1